MKFVFSLLLLFVVCSLWCVDPNTDQSTVIPQIDKFNDPDRTVPLPPNDVSITLASGAVKLSWTKIANATGYHVEASNAVAAGFTDISTTGGFTTVGNIVSWSVTPSAPYKFYRVKTLGIPVLPFNFATVAGGTFNNGTSDVTISTFKMDLYETTQGDYQAIMGSNPAQYYGVGASYPVYYVNWFNAIKYCNLRSMGEGLTPCYSYLTYGTNPNSWPAGWINYHLNISCDWSANGYRMPTEMEWKFAARGGIATHNYTYSGSNTIGDVAWYNTNASGYSHVVGTKAPNELGIYDMTGNVWEWCWDIWATSYPPGAQTNPHGPTTGNYRVFCGGSCADAPAMCAITYHQFNNSYPDTSYYTDLGFRVCRAN